MRSSFTKETNWVDQKFNEWKKTQQPFLVPNKFDFTIDYEHDFWGGFMLLVSNYWVTESISHKFKYFYLEHMADVNVYSLLNIMTGVNGVILKEMFFSYKATIEIGSIWSQN